MNDASAPADDGGGAATETDASADAAESDAATRGDSSTNTSTVCTETLCPPETFEQGLYGPVSVAVDATHVYWIEVGTTIPQGDQFGQLVRLPKDTTCKERSCFDVIDWPSMRAGSTSPAKGQARTGSTAR